MSVSVTPDGLKMKNKTLVRNSDSYKDLASGASTPCAEKSSQSKDNRMAILSFSKNDLLQLLGLLEAELEARELVISSLKSERAKILHPSSNNHQQYTLHDPYAALSRDEDGKGPLEDGKKAVSDPVAILQMMVDRHKSAEEHMKKQLDELSKSHNQVLKELALERQKHAQETAHGDDVTYFLEKDRERLSQQVDFEKAQQKKMERETKRAQTVLIDERKKHMSVVKALLDEHRFLQNELAEALQRLEQADCEAHACKVDMSKALSLLNSERQKAEKREAEIERQISEFDIEREQLMGKLKREESRTKKLQESIEIANARISELEHVLELSRDLQEKDTRDMVGRTKVTETKFLEESPSVSPITYRPKSSTFPSTSSAQVNFARSSKLFTPRGFKSSLRTEKSESSSGSSEELSSPNTQKVNLRTKNRSSGEFVSKRGSNESLEKSSGDETVIDAESFLVTGKPKVASVTPSRRIDTVKKGPSPSNSMDKLSTKGTATPPTDLTKISKIPAMTKKVVTVGVVSPQQTRKSSEPEATPPKVMDVSHVKENKEPPSKPLTRPNNLSTPPPPVGGGGVTSDQTHEVTHKQTDVLSPTGSAPGRPILPYTTFSGVNVKAKAAQLISPNSKRNFVSGSPAGMKATSSSPAASVGSSKPATQVNGNVAGDPGTTNSPPGVHGTKRASPRGTPPPVPPNKPTLIPQKFASSSTSSPPLSACTSVSSSSSSVSPPLPSGTKHNTPISPPPIANKRPDSLVEARKLFYANKHGSGSVSVNSDNPSTVHVRNTHNVNSNNSNNYRSSSDVLEIDVPPLDRFPAAPVPVKVGSKMENEQDSCCLNESNPAMLLCQSVLAQNAVWHCMFTFQGTPSWIASPAPCLLNWTGPLHQAALRSDSATICRLIEEKNSPNISDKDGSTPLYVAALVGSDECVELLLNLGSNCSVHEEHGFTPLHAAAYEGHTKCCKLLIDHGSKVNCPDDQDWCPIHWAVVKGHVDCVRILYDKGASLGRTTKTGWTVFHIAARFGQNDCLKSLLDLKRSDNNDNSRDNNHNPMTSSQLKALISTPDQDSWTVAHLLASSGNLHGLKILNNAGLLFLNIKDQWNQSPLDIATDSCKDYLNSLVGIKVHVTLDLTNHPPKLDTMPFVKSPRGTDKKMYTIGSVTVGPTLTWDDFYTKVSDLLGSHCQFLNSIVRLEEKPQNLENGSKSPQEIGITRKSIYQLKCATTEWSVGQVPSSIPYDMFSSTPDVTIKLNGARQCSLDHLAYDSLIPLETLQNYLRLIEQYKRVIFYGPVGSGKTSLAIKMAEIIKARLEASGRHSDMTYIPLNSRVTHQEFVKLLLSKGFLVPTSPSTFQPKPICPVLILDGLEKVSMSDVFGDLLQSLERPTSPVPIKVPNSGSSSSFILNRECVIIGSMDKARLSVDLSVQQHLRWIRLHWEQEPVVSLLMRHLLRKLADHQRSSAIDEESIMPVTWVCQVWHSFNESLVRLGLPDLVIGPKKFYACPFGSDMVETISRWMCLLWNHSLAPLVEEAVHRGNMMKNSPELHSKEREKVANTALYVLLQKAVFPGCPVANGGREDYFSSFRGVSATLSQLNSATSNNTRRPRRSKSMDRNRTSNKAAAMAKRQMLQEYAGSESNRSGRSFIPRRIGGGSSRSSPSPPPVPEKPKFSSSGSKSIPSSPAEERDLMESLLKLNTSQEESSIEELIQLQEKLFGQNNNRMTHYNSRTNSERNGTIHSPEDVGKEQNYSRPMPHGTPTKSNRKNGVEDAVWSVWEETV
ncbi:Cortactin-binding protein 2 [Holothuria leucospilota]|uniref:Cortactin-binding protein 2 n=1 Tax=Holothuria leucospilota TaxID=206669 RepID=A0A9Q1HJJ0_HOLLE|nr:Cortactin-binding protein 2 [Holothuria leucospilota]